MELLITYIEFAEYRNISKKLDQGKIEEHISLAQQSDLVEVLGDFYFDVLENKDELSWADLLNGSRFTYCNESFEHSGIKKLLADYTYSRYIDDINNNQTAFGLQEKHTNDSSPVSREVIKNKSKQGQIDGGFKFRYIEKYIMSNPTLFARYCKNKENKTMFTTQKFSVL